MSRSGYTDDHDNGMLAMWRGQVASATRGKRGQALLMDLLAALDAMPVKRLITNNFVTEGEHCTLGVLGAARGIEMKDIPLNEDDYGDEQTARIAGERFNIARQLAAEIMYMNDEGFFGAWDETETPEHRWQRMRAWVASQIAKAKP